MYVNKGNVGVLLKMESSEMSAYIDLAHLQCRDGQYEVRFMCVVGSCL